MGRIASLVALATLVLGCTPHHADVEPTDQRSAEPSAGPTPPPPGPVVVTLQTRNHEVTVYSGDDLRFTIAVAGSGAILAERIDAEEFAKSFPGIHHHFQRAFADEGVVWAGM
jgi:hypothetical protein